MLGGCECTSRKHVKNKSLMSSRHEPECYDVSPISLKKILILDACYVELNVDSRRFHYGAPSDYDEWAALQKGQPGANGWSYKEFHPYAIYLRCICET